MEKHDLNCLKKLYDNKMSYEKCLRELSVSYRNLHHFLKVVLLPLMTKENTPEEIAECIELEVENRKFVNIIER